MGYFGCRLSYNYLRICDKVYKNLHGSSRIQQFLRHYSSSEDMKVLNVAEKNDAAKNIAGYLSRGNSRRREGLSPYNKIYEFNMQLWNKNCEMIMTSVSGHLLNYNFLGACRKWSGCHPLMLFDAPVSKECGTDSAIKIKQTLEREARKCAALIIWTDCDREGENIGFEIIEVCKRAKSNIKVYRAKFSEITQASINRAIQTLVDPDEAVSKAVDVRSELDLRIGAAFTRFQTMRLKKIFPRTLEDLLISYGSCQFPTLGFVVERFLAIDNFIPEPYWKIKVTDIREDITVHFVWARIRLFEQLPCEVLLDACLEHPQATVQKVTSKPKSKWRPLPLDTIELEKQGSRKLRLSAKETMKIAEKLYTRGIISYPRTETNIFPQGLDLAPLVRQQENNSAWGSFAQRLLENGVNPRQGKKSDQAHPPIHPTKYADNLQGDEAKVYEFVVRHFLACLSDNAVGQETLVEIDIAGEKFTANGLEIIAKNYLEVYIYEKWNNKEIHAYREGQVFRPTSIDMIQEQTSPPELLTEADLIALMDKHGIGTDATHAEHIETIKSRHYVGLVDNKHFMPGKLGIGLVMGYDRMGFEMSKPNLRAELERDLQLICDRRKNPGEVLQTQINKYREVFQKSIEQAALLDRALADYLDENPLQAEQMQFDNIPAEVSVLKCPKCNTDMILRDRKQGGGKFIGCMGYPTCTNAIWFPQTIENVEVTSDICTECSTNIRKLKFKIKRNAFPVYGTEHTTCIGGCDPDFNEALNIRIDRLRNSSQSNDTGYSSNFNSTRSNTVSSRTEVRDHGTQRSTVTGSRRNSVENVNPSLGLVRNQSSQRANNRTGSENRNKSKRPEPKSSATKEKDPTPSWGKAEEDNAILCHCHEAAIKLTVKKDGPNRGRTFYACSKPQGSRCNLFLWGEDGEESQQHDAQRNPSHQSSSSWTDWGGQNNTTAGSSNNWSNNNQSGRSRTDWGGQNNTTAGSSNNWSSNNQSDRSRNDRGGQNNTIAGPSSWGNNSTFAHPSTSNDVICNCSQPAKLLTVYKEGPNKGRQFYGCPQGVESTCNFFQWADDSSNQSDRTTNNRGRGNSTAKKSRATGGKRKCGICGVEGHTRKTCPENVMD